MAVQTSWPWQRLNEGNASSHELLTTMLEPQLGERWLDVGTGGGGLALQLARAGTAVVGVDIADDGLQHARTLAGSEGLSAEFVLASAEELPFDSGSFDGVASAFGVIFAQAPERAAGELARVCRPGGKVGLTLMPPDSRTGETFSVLGRYGRSEPHPASWVENVHGLLGEEFELEVERHESPAAAPAPAPSWEESLQSFAALRDTVSGLDEDGAASLRAELEDVQHRYRDRPHSYFIVLGRRR
jgi:SAM-dependent methyltransferase